MQHQRKIGPWARPHEEIEKRNKRREIIAIAEEAIAQANAVLRFGGKDDVLPEAYQAAAGE